MSNLLKQSDAAAEVARKAFAAGDLVTGIAAVQLAAQLVQLARLKEDREERERAAARRDPRQTSLLQ